MNTSIETIHLLALSRIQGIGSVLAKQLVSYCGGPSRVFTYPKGKLLKVPGIGEKLAQSILDSRSLEWAEQECLKAEEAGVKVFSYLDAQYPSRLKQIPDAPLVIFFKGDVLCLEAPRVVGIVGTRRATHYGHQITEAFIKDLAGYGKILIVSGLAYGIDGCAHKMALRYQLPTVGVLAHGLGSIYPPSHASLAAQFDEAGGGLISEYPLHTKPESHYFPERNRIIAGLCDAIVVIEARQEGGALITAQIANSYHREVFAVPGDAFRDTSKGCHALIQQHQAHLLTSAADLISVMGWDNAHVAPKQEKQLPPSFTFESQEEERIAKMLQQEAMHIDKLSISTNLPMSQLAGLLLQLEFKGMVKPLPGKRFEWVG